MMSVRCAHSNYIAKLLKKKGKIMSNLLAYVLHRRRRPPGHPKGSGTCSQRPDIDDKVVQPLALWSIVMP